MRIEVVTNAPEEEVTENVNAVVPDLLGDSCCKMNILVIAREVEIEQECECNSVDSVPEPIEK